MKLCLPNHMKAVLVLGMFKTHALNMSCCSLSSYIDQLKSLFLSPSIRLCHLYSLHLSSFYFSGCSIIMLT